MAVMKIDVPPDHVAGGFKWLIKPDCCDQMGAALEEKFIFLANMADTEHSPNVHYMMPVTADGTFARSSGVPIAHCPWCGVKVKGKKKHSSKG